MRLHPALLTSAIPHRLSLHHGIHAGPALGPGHLLEDRWWAYIPPHGLSRAGDVYTACLRNNCSSAKHTALELYSAQCAKTAHVMRNAAAGLVKVVREGKRGRVAGVARVARVARVHCTGMGH